MDDLSLLSDDELDALLFAQVEPRRLKVAMVIARSMRPYQNWDEERVGRRITALVEAGKVESFGDVRNWASEIGLKQPDSANYS